MQQGDDTWLAWRRRKVATFSGAANAIGVGHMSPRAYMKRRLGMVPEDPVNDMMRLGNALEAWTACMYNRLVHDNTAVFRYHATCELQFDDRFGGSVDRLVVDRHGNVVVLELKVRASGAERFEVPVEHCVQMLCYCAAYGVEKAHYFVYTPDKSFFAAEVTFAPNLWCIVYDRLVEFAMYHKRKELPPKMKRGERDSLCRTIMAHVFVNEIRELSQKVPVQQLQ